MTKLAKLFVSLVVLLILLFSNQVTAAQTPSTNTPIFPVRTGFIIDTANVLSTETERKLTEKLETLANVDNTELVIATIPSLNGTNIENYTYQLGNQWRIGQQEYPQGILILMTPQVGSTPDSGGAVRIESSFGLQKALSDFTLFGIYREQMFPALENKDYDTAASNAVYAITQAIENQETASIFSGNKIIIPQTQLIIIIVCLFILTILASLLTKPRGWYGGTIVGTMCGILLSIFNYNLSWAILVLFLIGFISDRIKRPQIID